MTKALKYPNVYQDSRGNQVMIGALKSILLELLSTRVKDIIP